MSGITVTVRLNAGMAARLGARRTVELDAGATVQDLLARLAEEAGYAPRELRGLAVVGQGRFLEPERPLRDGEELGVMVPVAGG